MSTTNTELDIGLVQSFAFNVFGDITAQQMGALGAVGDRLGLLEILAESGPVTSSQFAERASTSGTRASGCPPLACQGFLAYEATTETSELPREHALVLSQPDSPLYLGSVFPMSQSSWKHVDQLAEAFKHGGGGSTRQPRRALLAMNTSSTAT